MSNSYNNNNTYSQGTTRDSISKGSAGSGLGNKLKGAVQVVHGAGENLRGTVLGAADTLGREGPTHNDEIARQGRLEMERGLANLRGTHAVAQTNHGTGAATATNNKPHPNPNNGFSPGGGGGGAGVAAGHDFQSHPSNGRNTNTFDAPAGYYANGASHQSRELGGVHDAGYQSQTYDPPTTTDTSFNDGGTNAYPSHHREDAIARVPTPQLREVQALNENQAHSVPSSSSKFDDPNTTTAAYGQQDSGGVERFDKESGSRAGGNIRSAGAPGLLH